MLDVFKRFVTLAALLWPLAVQAGYPAWKRVLWHPTPAVKKSPEWGRHEKEREGEAKRVNLERTPAVGVTTTPAPGLDRSGRATPATEGAAAATRVTKRTSRPIAVDDPTVCDQFNSCVYRRGDIVVACLGARGELQDFVFIAADVKADTIAFMFRISPDGQHHVLWDGKGKQVREVFTCGEFWNDASEMTEAQFDARLPRFEAIQDAEVAVAMNGKMAWGATLSELMAILAGQDTLDQDRDDDGATSRFVHEWLASANSFSRTPTTPELLAPAELRALRRNFMVRAVNLGR